MNDADKAKVELAITDRIDELSLMLNREAQTDSADDEDAKLHQLASGSIDSAVAKTNNLEIRSLRRSLNWLASDDGGYCEGCGREIGSDRLVAVPSARTCIECAKKREV